MKFTKPSKKAVRLVGKPLASPKRKQERVLQQAKRQSPVSPKDISDKLMDESLTLPTKLPFQPEQ